MSQAHGLQLFALFQYACILSSEVLPHFRAWHRFDPQCWLKALFLGCDDTDFTDILSSSRRLTDLITGELHPLNAVSI